MRSDGYPDAMLADRPHGRRLSAAERMRLDDLGRRLAQDDPALAEALRQGRPRPQRLMTFLRGGVSAVACGLVVLAVLVGGVGAAAAMALSVAATVLLVAAAHHRRDGGPGITPDAR